MINHKTILALRDHLSGAKGFVLGNSPKLGQWILIVFILTVVYMALKPCDCAIINERFERFEDERVSHLVPRAREQEHPVLEEGSGAPIHDISTTSRLFWRWSERTATRDNIFHDAKGEPHQVELVTLDGHAPGLFLRQEPYEQVLANKVFHAREVDAFQRDHATPFNVALHVHESTAFLAYFPEDHGIGVEVYAVDLHHNSPIWRTTVRTFDATPDVKTEVQLFVRDGRLQVMTKEGELRRIDELAASSGEILSMQEVDAGWTELPIQEAMQETFYTSCVFHVDASGAEDRPDCVAAPPTSELLLRGARRDASMSLVRRHAQSDTVYWRLNPAGEQFTLFPVSKLWPEPSTDILLAHAPGYSANVLIALDHESGDVLWSTGFTPGEPCKASEACQPLSHHLVKVDVSRVGEEPALVVYGEEDDELYTTYLDPRTGQIRAMLHAMRAQ